MFLLVMFLFYLTLCAYTYFYMLVYVYTYSCVVVRSSSSRHHVSHFCFVHVPAVIMCPVCCLLCTKQTTHMWKNDDMFVSLAHNNNSITQEQTHIPALASTQQGTCSHHCSTTVCYYDDTTTDELL
eukprot:GHVS01058719.1.p1 GENE.GHVS01058719.1~~GHVS01058719.1.p1  ORF type:complete len:126 (+),score=18.10 GHVS01058719.1:321-698(+)